MAQSASKSCDICMSGPGRNYCKQCDQWMCENCKTLHLRSKICRNHSFLSESKIVPEESPLCKEHNENFIFYCVDCGIPICKMCIVKNHKNHYTSEINESTQELQVEVKKFMDSRIKCVKTNLDKIEQGTVKYQSDINEAICVITEDGKQMKQWIDQKVKALITSLEEKGTANLKALSLIRTDFQNDLEKFQKCQTAFTESQKLADVTKLLTQLKHIKSELDIAGEKQSPVMSTVKYYKKNVSEREIFILFGDLSFRKQSEKTLFRYQCDHCWEERLSENNPTSWPIHGRFFMCKNCRFLRWFFLKEEK
ncbi:transcription intermediary factor 1-alpha-like isoform X2 [Mytilus californianus]|uniref:transcription intermediary factor 1-alpha-like isoform X2 n=1 Tax=Mytilus californianus TaxID=6549 RepID=UPI002245A0DC|nr:transcription intermediary factor 1-alpha-like isoform X2 [Mytilus californianus]